MNAPKLPAASSREAMVDLLVESLALHGRLLRPWELDEDSKRHLRRVVSHMLDAISASGYALVPREWTEQMATRFFMAVHDNPPTKSPEVVPAEEGWKAAIAAGDLAKARHDHDGRLDRGAAVDEDHARVDERATTERELIDWLEREMPTLSKHICHVIRTRVYRPGAQAMIGHCDIPILAIRKGETELRHGVLRDDGTVRLGPKVISDDELLPVAQALIEAEACGVYVSMVRHALIAFCENPPQSALKLLDSVSLAELRHVAAALKGSL